MNPRTALWIGLSCAIGALAQTQTPPPSIGGALDREVSLVEAQVVGAASAMPADKFDFSPESLNIKGSDFKGVYTFAGLVKHLGAANYFLWSGAAGEQPPAMVEGIKGPSGLKSKDEIVQFLKDSFAVGHRAAKMLTAENSTDLVPGPQGNKVPRIFGVTFTLVHAFDEYGQMAEYLRMNGVVPPASAPRPAASK
jgi:hypothetical protein